MLKRIAVLTLAVAAAMWLIPAADAGHAGHVGEPTAPVEGVSLRLSHYETRTSVACDGTTVARFPFDDARMEADVAAAAAPSEHFGVWVLLKRSDDGVRFKQEWSQNWRHQNIPPHSNPTRWEGGETNQYNLQNDPGDVWRVDVRVTGQESGRTFTDSCVFRRV